MKLTLALLAMALVTSAHAGAVAGRSGTSGGQQTGGYSSAASHGTAAGQSGNATGRAYFAPVLDGSVVDQYQPWPQSEMRQFQKK